MNLAGSTSQARYLLPVGANIFISEGDMVEAGDVIVKIPRETTKTKDITGGLPRVAELFEARKPKEFALISDIDFQLVSIAVDADALTTVELELKYAGYFERERVHAEKLKRKNGCALSSMVDEDETIELIDPSASLIDTANAGVEKQARPRRAEGAYCNRFGDQFAF